MTPGQRFYLAAENDEVVVGSAMNGEASATPSLYSFKAYDQSCPIIPKPRVEHAERCESGTLTLLAEGAADGNYRWYNSEREMIEGEVNADFNTPILNRNTTFYVSITDGPCESELVPVRAYVHPIPDAPVASDVARCEAGEFVLQVTGANDGNFRWYDADGNRIDNEVNATYTTPFLEESTSYFVSVVQRNCESERVEVRAILSPIPDPPIINDEALCGPAAFTLIANGASGGSYRWYDADENRIEDETSASFTTPVLDETTSFYVAIFNGGCESEKTEVQAIVNPVPDAPAANDVAKCEAGEFVLQASGANDGSYRWYDADQNLLDEEVNASFTTPVLDETTSFYVAIFDGTCESEKTEVQAIVNPVPDAPAAVDVSRCGPGEFVLQASGANDGNFRWYDADQNLLDEEVNASFTTPVLDETTSFYVAIFDGTCESEKTEVKAVLDAVPLPPIVVDADRCGPGELILLAKGSSDGNYRWYDGNGRIIDDEVNASFTTPTLTVSTSFFVSIFDGTCESEKVEVEAIVNSIPETPVMDKLSICKEGEVRLEPSNSGVTLFRWYTQADAEEFVHEGPAASFVPYISSDTTFYVSSLNGQCESDRIPFAVDLIQIPEFDAGEELFILPEEWAALQATEGFTNYQWYPSDGLSNDAIPNPQASPSKTTTYQVRAETVEGCIVTDEITVNVVNNFPVPNAFTPNGDGLNDYWEMPLIHNYPDCKVTIYNRWGEVVFYSAGYQQAWDGKGTDGKPIPGTYLYKIDFGNGKKPKTGKLIVL